MFQRGGVKKKETSVFIVVNVLFVLQGSDVFDGEDLKTVVDPPLQRWSTCRCGPTPAALEHL